MSDYLDPNNEELLKDFFSEAQMQVDTLEQNVLVLETDGTNHDAIDEIFRAAHTLKGGAATVEMTELAHFTHLVEDVLDAIRSDNLSVNEEVVDVLLSAIDITKEMLSTKMNGFVYSGNSSQTEERLKSLLPVDKSVKKSSKTDKAKKKTVASVAVDDSLSAGEIKELLDASGGLPVYKISVQFDENALMNTVGGIQVYTSIKDKGTILKTVPDFDMLYGDTFFPTVDYYLASNEDPEKLKKRVILPDVSLDAIITSITSKSDALQPDVLKSDASHLDVLRLDTPTASAEQKLSDDMKKAGKDSNSVLRVDSKRIDDLLNLVSEIVITKATFNQITNQFGTLANEFRNRETRYRERVKNLLDSLPEYLEQLTNGSTIKDVRKEIMKEFSDTTTIFENHETSFRANVVKFRATSQNLARITSELQEGVMRIRMVPISQIFSRFPRLVRDLSKSLDKKINLVIEGEDTELDKSVIEDLLDPIMHSVRNSVDHGIESPAERKAAGKDEDGIVVLKAANEGNMIVIEISDDGKGIDVESVKQTAIEKGLIHPNKVLTDIEAFNLIFEPGFSTAKSVTNISGRGVGLDVVRRQIEKLNGRVSVISESGVGTKFIIKLPLTLAIIQGLLVRVGDQIYSIPISSVIESLRIKPDDIKLIDSNEVFNIRNDVLSLLRLNQLFGIKTETREDYNFIVIVGSTEKKMGFLVDSLIGEEDIVIKPLRDQYTNSPGIAGASILGDGSVSLIIDVNQLLELGLHKEIEHRKLRDRDAD